MRVSHRYPARRAYLLRGTSSPDAGRYGAGETHPPAVSALPEVLVDLFSPRAVAAAKRVGAGGAPEQDSGEGADALVNFSAQVRVGVRAFEQLVELGGYQGR